MAVLRNEHILTQFFALELPEGWEADRLLLVGSELHEWYAKFNPPFLSGRDLAKTRFLLPLARLHGVAVAMMNAIADGEPIRQEWIEIVREGMEYRREESSGGGYYVRIPAGVSHCAAIRKIKEVYAERLKRNRIQLGIEQGIGFALADEDMDGFLPLPLTDKEGLNELPLPPELIQYAEPRESLIYDEVIYLLHRLLTGEVNLERDKQTGGVKVKAAGRPVCEDELSELVSAVIRGELDKGIARGRYLDFDRGALDKHTYVYGGAERKAKNCFRERLRRAKNKLPHK